MSNRASTGNDTAPLHSEPENTERTSRELHSTLAGVSAEPPAANPADVLELLATKVAKKMNGGGNGNGAPPPTRKQIITSKAIWTLVVTLCGTGGVLATNAMTTTRSETNEVRSNDNAKKIDAVTSEHTMIKVRLGNMDKSMESFAGSQKDIAKSVKALKKENVDRIEKELDKAERRVDQLEREKRRRER